MDIITRQEALERGLTRYFTGKPCPHGHVAERTTKKSNCLECECKWQKKTYLKYRKANPEKVRETNRKWHETNREKVRERHRKWCEANPEKGPERIRKWCATNRDKTRAHTMKRHASKLQAMPPWLTEEHKQQIADIYEQVVLCEHLTGVKHHVDHIEPLQGKDRCGLHVPWNLQVLEARENTSKGNRPVRHVLWKKR